jgi:peptidoglycan/LPS O-acetylase OafA/YrhL
MLGEVSYSFFLTHGVVIALYFPPDWKGPRALHRRKSRLSSPVAIALAFGLCIDGVEQPMRRRFSR